MTRADNKQLFIDNFAHEIKTPLTAIYGYTEYLQKADLKEEDRQFSYDCILSESKRIQVMAGQMMELANLRSNEIHREILGVSELFNKVEQSLSYTARKKEIDLQFCADNLVLYGDIVLLESLLINLINNAIKASEPGSQIRIKAFEDDNTSIISVTDDGKGIPQAALAKLTQPYYRVEKHRHRQDGGAGLGLSLCEQIVQQHHAKLSFISTPGIGTEVRVTFTTL
jgi:signal transduction histidine kinase